MNLITVGFSLFAWKDCIYVSGFLCCFSSMRRDVLVEVGSKGMIKTGLKSDMCQVSLAGAFALLDLRSIRPTNCVSGRFAWRLFALWRFAETKGDSPDGS